MYSTLLVPIDFEHKERIIPMITAARTMSNEGSRIVLAHIGEPLSFIAGSEMATYKDYDHDHDQETKKKAHRDLEQIADEFDLPRDIQVGLGHPSKEILEIADTIKADVIIIASHKPGWQDFLIGSTAKKLVSNAKCAVHVIR